MLGQEVLNSSPQPQLPSTPNAPIQQQHRGQFPLGETLKLAKRKAPMLQEGVKPATSKLVGKVVTLSHQNPHPGTVP